MKKTIAITSALAAASSLATAEIKINEFLSFEGFVDMSYSHTDTDVMLPAKAVTTLLHRPSRDRLVVQLRQGNRTG